MNFKTVLVCAFLSVGIFSCLNRIPAIEGVVIAAEGAVSPQWKEIIVHYSYSTHMSKEQCNDWHKERGFDDCGYAYILSPEGRIEEGRSLDRIGAHARGHNAEAIGIVFVSKGQLRREQIESFNDLHKKLEAIYGPLPLRVHKEVGATECPGELITEAVKACVLK